MQIYTYTAGFSQCFSNILFIITVDDFRQMFAHHKLWYIKYKFSVVEIMSQFHLPEVRIRRHPWPPDVRSGLCELPRRQRSRWRVGASAAWPDCRPDACWGRGRGSVRAGTRLWPPSRKSASVRSPRPWPSWSGPKCRGSGWTGPCAGACSVKQIRWLFLHRKSVEIFAIFRLRRGQLTLGTCASAARTGRWHTTRWPSWR